jgi:fatty acid desaturase
VLVYALLATVGSWSYSLLTVHLPHRNYGETPLTQTHTLRGTIIPGIFLELTYHLEHHLYPQVPSHNLHLRGLRIRKHCISIMWLNPTGSNSIALME